MTPYGIRVYYIRFYFHSKTGGIIGHNIMYTKYENYSIEERANLIDRVG